MNTYNRRYGKNNIQRSAFHLPYSDSYYRRCFYAYQRAITFKSIDFQISSTTLRGTSQLGEEKNFLRLFLLFLACHYDPSQEQETNLRFFEYHKEPSSIPLQSTLPYIFEIFQMAYIIFNRFSEQAYLFSIDTTQLRTYASSLFDFGEYYSFSLVYTSILLRIYFKLT